MNHIISLVVGDWSGDGHDKKDTINIRSNLDKKAMEKAYKAGTKKVGFDLCADVCSDYEDRNLDSEKWEKLKELGYQDEELEDEADKYNNGDISLWVDSFTDIYLFIVKLGNEKFEFEYLAAKEDPTIKIGGYGLFD